MCVHNDSTVSSILIITGVRCPVALIIMPQEGPHKYMGIVGIFFWGEGHLSRGILQEFNINCLRV